MLMIKPRQATMDPAIATARHPNLFVSELAMGPRFINEKPTKLIQTMQNKYFIHYLLTTICFQLNLVKEFYETHLQSQ